MTVDPFLNALLNGYFVVGMYIWFWGSVIKAINDYSFETRAGDLPL
jgi:hypothetical protein